MSELTEFLLARIAEDESVARAAVIRSDDPDLDGVDTWDVLRGQTVIGPALDKIRSLHLPDESTAAHIARHDPARVLRECAAKREIVRRCGDVGALMPSEHLARGVLGLLASVYADHPDFCHD